jgi:uncharacterized membrane protein YsdA (DUF1294 family)
MNSRPSPTRFKQRSSGRLDGFALIALAHLLIIPGYVLTRLLAWVDWRLLLAAPLVLSLVSFLTIRSDKRRAESETWRIPELSLHFFELIGGWPGSFLAQRMYRHKTAKISYQLVFWLIVAIYEFAAIDFLLDWRFTRDFLFFVQTHF